MAIRSTLRTERKDFDYSRRANIDKEPPGKREEALPEPKMTMAGTADCKSGSRPMDSK